MIAIADAGPVIHLSWLHRLDLLRAQFERVIVPPAVHRELLRAPAEAPGLSDIEDAIASGWLAVAETPEHIPGFTASLGAGESEAILLALQLSGNFLTDDAAARAEAEFRGLLVMGTLGILLSARSRGLIPAAYPLLVEMQTHGFWLSKELAQAVAADENST